MSVRHARLGGVRRAGGRGGVGATGCSPTGAVLAPTVNPARSAGGFAHSRDARPDQRSSRFVGFGDVDHDDGDVVATTLVVGQPDEFLGRFLRAGQPAENRMDLVVVQFVEEPVAAQQEAVTGPGLDRPTVHDEFGVDAEGSGEHVSARVVFGLLRRDLTLAHHLLDE